MRIWFVSMMYNLTLEDVTTNSTTYILQYLWCDLTSHFDVFSPHYTSSGVLESKFILMETIKIFQSQHLCLSTCMMQLAPISQQLNLR